MHVYVQFEFVKMISTGTLPSHQRPRRHRCARIQQEALAVPLLDEEGLDVAVRVNARKAVVAQPAAAKCLMPKINHNRPIGKLLHTRRRPREAV